MAFGIDSHNVPFLTEAATYFSLGMAGLILCAVAAVMYTKESRYGEEDNVILPEAFERNRGSFANTQQGTDSKEATVKIEAFSIICDVK